MAVTAARPTRLSVRATVSMLAANDMAATPGRRPPDRSALAAVASDQVAPPHLQPGRFGQPGRDRHPRPGHFCHLTDPAQPANSANLATTATPDLATSAT
jgi:hypothetical protein